MSAYNTPPRNHHLNRFDLERQHDLLLREQIITLLEREVDYVTCGIAPCSPSHSVEMPRQHTQWRPKICEWCYRVVDHFEFDRKVVFIAMEYFDRFLLLYPGAKDVSSRFYQLAAMTCLYTTMKLHADSLNDDSDDSDASLASHNEAHIFAPDKKMRRFLRLDVYVELSRGQFHPQDVVKMERTVLETLGWKLNPVSPMCFVSYFLMLLPRTPSWTEMSCWQQGQHAFSGSPKVSHDSMDLVLHVMHELSRYLAELAIICLPSLAVSDKNSLSPSAFKPSHIAYAAICLSMEVISSNSILSPLVREDFFHDIARLSDDASFRLTLTGQHMIDRIDYRLRPSHPDIQRLKNIIQSSFIPEVVLEQAISVSTSSSPTSQPNLQSQSRKNLKTSQIHPILIAKQAGLLNLHYIQRISSGVYTQSDCDIHDDVARIENDHQKIIRSGKVDSEAFSPTSVCDNSSH